MNIKSILGALVLLFSSTANSVVVNFEFLDDPLNLTPVFRGTHLLGNVTGSLFGLSDNLDNQIPTAILITSDVTGLEVADNYFSNFMDITYYRRWV